MSCGKTYTRRQQADFRRLLAYERHAAQVAKHTTVKVPPKAAPKPEKIEKPKVKPKVKVTQHIKVDVKSKAKAKHHESAAAIAARKKREAARRKADEIARKKRDAARRLVRKRTREERDKVRDELRREKRAAARAAKRREEKLHRVSCYVKKKYAVTVKPTYTLRMGYLSITGTVRGTTAYGSSSARRGRSRVRALKATRAFRV